jgi:dynein heavy chain
VLLQGLMLLPAAALPKDDPVNQSLNPTGPSPSVAAYKRLWVHEALRVFYDRLVDSQDRNWLLGQLQGIVSQHLGASLDQLMGHLLQPGESEVGQEQLRR